MRWSGRSTGDESVSATHGGRHPNSAVPLVPRPRKGTEMRKWQKPLIGVGLGAVLGPAVLSMVVTPTRAQPPSRVEVKETPVTKSAESPTAGQGLDPQAGPFQQELELVGLQVQPDRAQPPLSESRLEH